MTTIKLNTTEKQHIINPNIYGHFAEHLGACIYKGIYVGEDSQIPNTQGLRNDVVEALKNLDIPVLRWPGGCFADEYHWMDGIGDKAMRPTMVNTNWGGVVENNHFGTHEFMLLCELIGAEPYICGNVGSGTVLEMQQWVEYLTAKGDTPMSRLRTKNGRARPWKIKYFGVGNENWGCGGNMTAEYYANEYRRFSMYLKNTEDNQLYKIACGPSGGDYHWMEVLMRDAGSFMNAIALHYYTGVDGSKYSRSATDFGEKEWFYTVNGAMLMDELLTKHSAIMDKYDPENRVALIVDEWGNWWDVEPGTNPAFLYQQNTLRDAITACVNFNIFNKHGKRVQMTNIAQTVNVLQSVVLTDGEVMIKTPTYYAFELYKPHMNAEYIKTEVATSDYRMNDDTIPTVTATASTKNGETTITIVNTNHAADEQVEITAAGTLKLAQILTGDKINSMNTADSPRDVCIKPLTLTKENDTIALTIPKASVISITLTN